MSWLTALGFGKKSKEVKDYSEEFGRERMQEQGEHICGYTAVNDRGEQIGTVNDYVMDANDKLRYLVIETGTDFSGKNITVPAGMAQIEDTRQEVILTGMNRDRIENMPAYDEATGFSEDYETNLMQSYYPGQRPYTTEEGRLDYDRYKDFRTPERLRLIEERLQVNKRTELEGEVKVGKRMETSQESVDVPVSRERVVIERKPVTESGAEVGDIEFQEESINIPVYKEEVDVTKRPVVAEEVTVRKEQETETQTVTETVGRERLDINDPGRLASEDRGVEGSVRDEPEASGKRDKVKVDVIPIDEQ